MKKTYIEDYTNLNMSESDIAIWKKGSGEELKKVIGEGLFDLRFERDGTKVTMSYEEQEGELVHEAIKEFLTDEHFDKLCEDFVKLIMKKQEIQTLMLPALIIFDEIDRYPYLANDYIKRRLMRIRTSTHEESYKWKNEGVERFINDYDY